MATVYFAPVPERATDDEIAAAARQVFDAADLGSRFRERDLVAVKSHPGEKGNRNVIPPAAIRAIGDRVKARGARPFLIETSTLYVGARCDAVSHLATACENGFGFDAVGMPIVMADGLNGDAEIEVPVEGGRLGRVAIAREALMADALLVATHVTGHIGTGYGGAIKNVGMGLASRRGKLRQHSAMKPRIDEAKCTACERCIPWCPAEAIAIQEGDGRRWARIDPGRCIGCGECLTVCRDGAVRFDWKVESGELQARMTEHAAGLLRRLGDRAAYMNFLVRLTKDCDCLGKTQPFIAADIGILASTDLVAVEVASLEIFAERVGRTLRDLSYPKLDPWVQIRCAERLGLGSRRHELVEVGSGARR